MAKMYRVVVRNRMITMRNGTTVHASSICVRGDDGRRLDWRLGDGSARSIRARRHARDAPNRRREMTRGPEPHRARDRADGGGGLGQQSGRGVDPAAHNEAMWRYTRGPLEEPREVIPAHVRDCRELLEPKLSVQIVLDERGHAANLALGKAADDHGRQPRVASAVGPPHWGVIALLFTASRFLGSCDALECRLSSRRALPQSHRLRLRQLTAVARPAAIPSRAADRHHRTPLYTWRWDDAEAVNVTVDPAGPSSQERRDDGVASRLPRLHSVLGRL